MSQGKANTPADFWRLVEKQGHGRCWRWIGGIHKSTGYGRFCLRKVDWHAHRLSYYFTHGKQANGFLCHTCDNRWCVNPGHFFVGTAADNCRDRVAKGRSARGESHGRGKLDADQVQEIRRMAAQDITQREIALRLGVGHWVVNDVIRGRTWAHVPPLANTQTLENEQKKRG